VVAVAHLTALEALAELAVVAQVALGTTLLVPLVQQIQVVAVAVRLLS
jgi:hypothetical protein